MRRSSTAGRRRRTGNGRAELGSALAAAGAGLVLYSNHRFGVGLTHDSIHYIAAARNLVAGRGLVGFDGTSYVDFPPLFPLLSVSVMAWSEPVFALLVLLMVMTLARGFEGSRVQGARWFGGCLLLLGLLGALACLQRYAGTFVVAGVALVLARRFARGRGPRGFLPAAALLVLLVYALALSVLTLWVGVGPFTRMLAPLYPLAVLAVLATIEEGFKDSRARGFKRRRAALLAVACAWLAYPVSRLAWLIPQWRQKGVGVYDAVEWQELEIVG